MIRFGTLKTKILQKLTDEYASGNRTEMKNLLREVVRITTSGICIYFMKILRTSI